MQNFKSPTVKPTLQIFCYRRYMTFINFLTVVLQYASINMNMYSTQNVMNSWIKRLNSLRRVFSLLC